MKPSRPKVIEFTQPLTRRETAEVLRCHERTVDRLVRKGKLRAVKRGRSVLIAAESARELLPQ